MMRWNKERGPLEKKALFCGSGSELNLHPNPVTHTQMLLIARLHLKPHLKGDWGEGEEKQQPICIFQAPLWQVEC